MDSESAHQEITDAKALIEIAYRKIVAVAKSDLGQKLTHIQMCGEKSCSAGLGLTLCLDELVEQIEKDLQKPDD